MAEKKNPALAILVGSMLAKKGMKKDLGSEKSEEDSEESYDSDEQLLMVAEDMLAAIKSEDASALRDLLREAFECMESFEHEEGPHLK